MAQENMSFLESIIARAKADKKTIVLPEGGDPRTIIAAREIVKLGIANIIVLGSAAELEAAGMSAQEAGVGGGGAAANDTSGAAVNDTSGAAGANFTTIDPQTSPDREQYIDRLVELRKHKGLDRAGAEKLINNNLYFATLMVHAGVADGMVAGACHSTGDVLRPALQILKTAPDAKMVSSYFVMCVPNCNLGAGGTFVFSDCGLEVQPTADRLANIALNAARGFEDMIALPPRVAMLSHSTFGSAKNDDAQKVVDAVALAHQAAPDLALDGELQLDAAIVPEVGKIKAPSSSVAGSANVLVFPDLDAANIGYKLVQRLAGAQAFGPITQGIARPVNDLSRGCSAEDIVGVVAITCVQAQQV